MTKLLTLSVIVQNNEILLGMKKRGFGEGKWNGFGGKVQAGETIAEALQRELFEESSLTAKKFHQVAKFDFTFPNDNTVHEVHVYLITEFSGELMESEEMLPRWFSLANIPYNDMWSDDILWLPRVLAGEVLTGFFSFNELGAVKEYELKNCQF